MHWTKNHYKLVLKHLQSQINEKEDRFLVQILQLAYNLDFSFTYSINSSNTKPVQIDMKL